MDADLAIVAGVIIAIFAVPAIFSSLSEQRTPRVALLSFVVSLGLFVYAVLQAPDGFQLGDVPNAFVRVIGNYLL